jgi:diguanylate cyclase (GGDEF)-like protein
MQRLIDHIVRLSALRNRTDLAVAFVTALADLFQPRSAQFLKRLHKGRVDLLFPCAISDAHGCRHHDAYLPDTRFCRPVLRDPLIATSVVNVSVEHEDLPDGAVRIVFPLTRKEEVDYLVDIVCPPLGGDAGLPVLEGLMNFMNNHLALIEYSETDTLTGLLNRKTFDEHLFRVLGQVSADDEDSDNDQPQRRHGMRESARHWLGVIDIDHFKVINDTHGHLIGDEVLVLMARLMRDACRFADQIFRLGGEEFVIVLQPMTRAEAFAVLDRLRTSVANHHFTQVGRVTLSCGFSHISGYALPADILDRADEALYYAKEHGRNQLACYETLIEQGRLDERLQAETDVELF